MEELGYIDRFGYEAVQTAPFWKLRRMIHAENVYNAYRERQRSTGEGGGWAKWEQDNPGKAKLLHRAMIAARGDSDDGDS